MVYNFAGMAHEVFLNPNDPVPSIQDLANTLTTVALTTFRRITKFLCLCLGV